MTKDETVAALCRNCGHVAHQPGDGVNGGCQERWAEPDGWLMVCGCRESGGRLGRPGVRE